MYFILRIEIINNSYQKYFIQLNMLHFISFLFQLYIFLFVFVFANMNIFVLVGSSFKYFLSPPHTSPHFFSVAIIFTWAWIRPSPLHPSSPNPFFSYLVQGFYFELWKLAGFKNRLLVTENYENLEIFKIFSKCIDSLLLNRAIFWRLHFLWRSTKKKKQRLKL